jgi:hypothetical protein
VIYYQGVRAMQRGCCAAVVARRVLSVRTGLVLP